MEFSRRFFLEMGKNAASLGAFSSALAGRPAIAQESCHDGDPAHIQKLTQSFGVYDLGCSETNSWQINWTYYNSKGELFTNPLIQNGMTISHPKNSLLTWEYDSKDSFDHTNRSSQIDSNYLILTRNFNDQPFGTLAVAQRNGNEIELVGSVSYDNLLNDARNPLTQHTFQDGKIEFHAAIGNLNADDVFTFILTSRRTFAVVSFDQNGMPRVLYELDARDENQNVFDPAHPDIKLTDGFEFSKPCFDLTNEKKYGIFFKSYEKGLYLFQFEPEGLKLVSSFAESVEHVRPYLSFPDQNYDWSVRLNAEKEQPSDAFVQALYNMGPHKETLMHWTTSDGHHVFFALHRNPQGEFEAYPRSLLKAFEPAHPGASWIVRPGDNVAASASATHSDAPDKIIAWSGKNGCAFLSLEPQSDGQYVPHVLRHVAVDDVFQDGQNIRFGVKDQFQGQTQYLTHNRRKKMAEFYQQTQVFQKQKSLSLFKNNHDEPLYRVHFISHGKNSVHTFDFAENQGSKPLAENYPDQFFGKKALTFKRVSTPLPVDKSILKNPDDMDAEDIPLVDDQSPQGIEKWAKKFIEAFQRWHNDRVLTKSQLSKLKDQLEIAICIYRDQYHVPQGVLDDFRTKVLDLAPSLAADNEQTIGIRNSLTLGSLGLGTLAGAVWTERQKNLHIDKISQEIANLDADLLGNDLTEKKGLRDFLKKLEEKQQKNSFFQSLKEKVNSSQYYRSPLKRLEELCDILDSKDCFLSSLTEPEPKTCSFDLNNDVIDTASSEIRKLSKQLMDYKTRERYLLTTAAGLGLLSCLFGGALLGFWDPY